MVIHAPFYYVRYIITPAVKNYRDLNYKSVG